ncbi:MAG: Ig-like domain repeat protein [Bacteroidetes bacterium]|nr:Ig-like domain repeat protein [Bacteroidota bacterium]HET6242903.1 Ig-like domain repeat protein [Bacteroidia bacterium]
MKNLKLLSMIALASVMVFSSCKREGCIDPTSLNYDPKAKKDDGSCLYGAVQLSLSSETAGNTPGNQVSTTVKLTAASGLKSLNILKNGLADANYPVIELNGTTKDHEFTYIVENLAIGSTINFSFQATDIRGEQSAAKTFVVTVTAVPAKQVIEISGDIETATWTKGNIYKLNGYCRVQDGKILTIEAGTVIMGDRETKGVLIIQRGGKILANGTASEPIIMTSERAPGLREPGDWGGLVICGRAKNNQGTDVELEGGYGGIHGGNDDNDNSGVVRYVQINYAGIPINPNEEVNSLTMGSVGKGTVIEHVQCAYGLDDAFEWFGGTVNCKYLVAYKCLDDDMDVDFGFSGNIQYALAIRGVSMADQSGSNGFEVDNNGSGALVAPYTSAKFSNVTMIGPKKTRETAISLQFQNAMHLRRSNKIKIYNSFLTGYPNGLFIDGVNTAAHATGDELQLRNVVLAGVEHWGGSGYGSAGTLFTNSPANGDQHPTNPRGVALKTTEAGFDVIAWYNTAGWGNQLLDKWQDAGINLNMFDAGKPTVTPGAGSILLTGADFTNANLSGMENVTFRGAFGATDWTAGWVDWNCALTEYN